MLLIVIVSYLPISLDNAFAEEESAEEHDLFLFIRKKQEVTSMSTYMPKAGQVDRKWYVIDAARGKPVGRVAAQAATLLRGKHKPIFYPAC